MCCSSLSLCQQLDKCLVYVLHTLKPQITKLKSSEQIVQCWVGGERAKIEIVSSPGRLSSCTDFLCLPLTWKATQRDNKGKGSPKVVWAFLRWTRPLCLCPVQGRLFTICHSSKKPPKKHLNSLCRILFYFLNAKIYNSSPVESKSSKIK